MAVVLLSRQSRSEHDLYAHPLENRLLFYIRIGRLLLTGKWLRADKPKATQKSTNQLLIIVMTLI
jgi:hypothetical protein